MSEHGYPPPTGPLDNPDVKHEPSDVNVKGILIVAGVMVVSAAVIHLGIWFLFSGLKGHEDRTKHIIRQGPTSVAQELQGVAAGQPHLEQFDRQQANPHNVSLPREGSPAMAPEPERGRIQHAMDLIVEKDLLPARPATEPAKPREANGQPPR
jgi:hypothetical protein